MLKTFRDSFRKKKTQDSEQVIELTSSTIQLVETGNVPGAWHGDETAVRNGICNFLVKYLGCIEVSLSRGTEICDEAFKLLKANKKASMKAVFYISGDGLRVVDEKTRGLIVDQAVEKVSFCAPVSSFDRGFCYICRDGTTQRWMCHGLIAKKEKGVQLCQAVGVAFTICAERKKKRQEECLLMFSPDVPNPKQLDSPKQKTPNKHQNILTSPSSRPQTVQYGTGSPFALARPRHKDLMFQRQSSFMGFGVQSPTNSPFKRQMSLRVQELPPNVMRPLSDIELKGGEDNPEFGPGESADAVSTFRPESCRPLPPLPTYRLSKPLSEIQNGDYLTQNKTHRGPLILCDMPSTITLDAPISATGNPFTPNFLAQTSGPTKTPLQPIRQDKFDFSDFECQVFPVRQEAPPPSEPKNEGGSASKNPFQSDMSPCPEPAPKTVSTNPFFDDDGFDDEEEIA